MITDPVKTFKPLRRQFWTKYDQSLGRNTLRLHEMACEMARLGIRRQHPSASAGEVEALLRQRLTSVRTQ